MSLPKHGTIQIRTGNVTTRVRVSNASTQGNRADKLAAVAALHEIAEAIWVMAGESARPTIVCLCGDEKTP